MTTANSQTTLLPHLFRLEYTKMTAVLCRHFGLHHIEIAEDIASDTFLKATETWPVSGIPPNPVAWLYTVAKNKTRDYLKRTHLYENKVKTQWIQNQELYPDIDFDARIITDSQLAMLFSVCNSANSPDMQVALALQVLCGFSVQEIADAFLSNHETIKKRLQRARANLRETGLDIQQVSAHQLNERLPAILKTLYLLFNEGYFSQSGDQFIRSELCAEAMRLLLLLAENERTNTGEVNALLALMCFQASRLAARADENGEPVLFDEQDRYLWDKLLIEKGNVYLIHAGTATTFSKYHIEAAIAFWHSTSQVQNKWTHILPLYNQLMLLDDSPAVKLNMVFAHAQVYGCAAAIDLLKTLSLNENMHYYALLGYLSEPFDRQAAIGYYQKAIGLCRSAATTRGLLQKIRKLSG